MPDLQPVCPPCKAGETVEVAKPRGRHTDLPAGTRCGPRNPQISIPATCACSNLSNVRRRGLGTRVPVPAADHRTGRADDGHRSFDGLYVAAGQRILSAAIALSLFFTPPEWRCCVLLLRLSTATSESLPITRRYRYRGLLSSAATVPLGPLAGWSQQYGGRNRLDVGCR